jgi:hypothetical protein
MKRTTLLFVLLIATTACAAPPDAREIVRKANEVMHGLNTTSTVRMTIVTPSWTRSLSLKTWALEPDYALVYVTEPARDRGTVTLKRKTEVWNWLPTVQRIIKLPPSMMLQSWMGSDLTNDDLVRQSSLIDDYTHALAGSDTVEGYACWKILLTPKPDAGVVWGKLVMWIAERGFISMRTQYFDEDGILVKSFNGSALRTFDGRTIPSHWEMVPATEPGKKTVFEYLEVNFRATLSPTFFSEQTMKTIR